MSKSDEIEWRNRSVAISFLDGFEHIREHSDLSHQPRRDEVGVLRGGPRHFYVSDTVANRTPVLYREQGHATYCVFAVNLEQMTLSCQSWTL